MAVGGKGVVVARKNTRGAPAESEVLAGVLPQARRAAYLPRMRWMTAAAG